jgi:cysteine synthase B
MNLAASTRRDLGVSILDLIGKTPLIRLKRLENELRGVELYAKAEWQNPGGSVKDRTAARILADAEQRGDLAKGRIILDATSGNTGIAYAMIAAARGWRVTLCVPENVTPERKRILKAYGATLVFTNPLEGSDGAIREARRMFQAEPDRYYYADQYNNASNWLAHYLTTGPEILQQTDGRVTHFVAGLGTSGTFVGVGRRLREHDPRIRLISVQPASPLHGLEGLIYDRSLADDDYRVTTEEAYDMTRRLAQQEGLLVGISSGAALSAALRAAAKLREGVVVSIFCDGGDRYLSERFWDEPESTTAGEER